MHIYKHRGWSLHAFWILPTISALTSCVQLEVVGKGASNASVRLLLRKTIKSYNIIVGLSVCLTT